MRDEGPIFSVRTRSRGATCAISDQTDIGAVPGRVHTLTETGDVLRNVSTRRAYETRPRRFAKGASTDMKSMNSR